MSNVVVNTVPVDGPALLGVKTAAGTVMTEFGTGNGPLTRYVKLGVAHAPGMSRTFSPPQTSNEIAS